MEKKQSSQKKTDYAQRLETGNACIPTAEPTAKPPKPADHDQIAPLMILY